jgi:hypothetical protein
VVAVGQQVLPAVRREPDRVREHPERERLGQRGDRVELRLGHDRVDQRLGSYRKLLRPTPDPDANSCQSVSAAWTCS